MEDRLITERLILRPFIESDIDPLFEIQNDSDAMRYTFSAQSREESETNLVGHANQLQVIGYAPWTICSRENDRVVGWGGLLEDPFEPGYGTEVAYFFGKEHWGKGYATEVVTESIDYGFNRLQLDSIGAFARDDNLGSIRVLTKCGFIYINYNDALNRNYYKISRKAKQ